MVVEEVGQKVLLYLLLLVRVESSTLVVEEEDLKETFQILVVLKVVSVVPVSSSSLILHKTPLFVV